ncbi:MAG: HAD-IIIA family hydrolase [Candidatus Curtissbacteria bacterium]|nr:HAD-IIIA family hydrolase [Candidatus Curtissbacteria bacterium]
MDAVILAGGKGERLGRLTSNTPKPLIKIGNKPLLEHQIFLLKRSGVKNLWILSGHLGDQIEDYFEDGERWGLRIHHLTEAVPLGTAGAMKQLELLVKDDFVLFSGDVMLDIDLYRLTKFHKAHKGSVATIVVHPNDHPFDSDLVETDTNNQVISFLVRKDKVHPKSLLFKNLTNAGIFIFSPEIFKYIKKKEKSDLEKDIFEAVLKSGGKIFAYNTPEYLKDVGTIARLKRVRADYSSGKITRLNLKNKRKAIFLDRDGTINEHDGTHNVRFSSFKLYPFTAQAIKKINKSDFLAIVITNQPAIAKGFIRVEELDRIHKKMETELGREGIKVDAIYYCPHHPEKGFYRELAELKINCSCRKPKIGMIRQAVRDFNIDLNSSYFIGDSTVDAECAKRAGLKFIAVETGYGLSDGRYAVPEDTVVTRNLYRAVSMLL